MRIATWLGWLSAAGLAMLGWAAVVEPRWLEVRRIEAPLPRLPWSWNGARIAVLADLQLGIRFGNTGTAWRAIESVIQAAPAVALLAGDFVYEAVRHPEPVLHTLASVLRPLAKSGIPTLAVLGNHDYGEEGSRAERLRLAAAVSSTLEGCGIRVLENEAAPVCREGGAGEPLYLVGLGAHIPNRDHPLRAAGQVPPESARVVFMHNPASFPELPPSSAPLALAGHTHGGQLRMPFIPRLTLGRLTVPWPEYVDGWLEGYGQPGNRLYVNRGIGFSRWPVRFGCRPELTLLTLRRAAPPAG